MRVFIEGLEFYGYHGVPDEEQKIGHRYELDIDLEVQESASETDSIDETVDYGRVAQLAVRAGQESQFRTIERLSSEICKRLLASDDKLQSVTVTVRKPMPPAPVIAKSVGVSYTSRR